jgi:hypothetical protein
MSIFERGYVLSSLFYKSNIKGIFMENQITIRSDRKTEYTFQYKGEDVTLKAGGILSIADGLEHVVLPTCAMKVINNLIIIKEDVK